MYINLFEFSDSLEAIMDFRCWIEFLSTACLKDLSRTTTNYWVLLHFKCILFDTFILSNASSWWSSVYLKALEKLSDTGYVKDKTAKTSCVLWINSFLSIIMFFCDHQFVLSLYPSDSENESHVLLSLEFVFKSYFFFWHHAVQRVHSIYKDQFCVCTTGTLQEKDTKE